MVADSRYREKTFKIEKKTFIIKKKILESRKIFQSQKKKIFMKSRKIFRNWEKYLKIEKNVLESRNILLQESRKNLEFNAMSPMNLPANIYLFKVNNRNTRKKVWNMFKVNKKTPERRQWYRSDVLIVNFEHIPYLVLLFLLLTLNK